MSLDVVVLVKQVLVRPGVGLEQGSGLDMLEPQTETLRSMGL